MRKLKLPLLLLLMIFLSACEQQSPEQYNTLVAEARSLYAAGEYQEAGTTYSRAFKGLKEEDSIAHRYEAACALARANQQEKAFEQLIFISKKGNFADLGQISTDHAFSSLRTDERWISILNSVSDNKKEAEAGLEEVALLLETVYSDDQKYRVEAGEIQEKYGRDSEEVKEHWELINKQDSVNLIKVEQVLTKYGWLGADLIGRNANSAFFLVIQHADLETQEKYLPMLREAVQKGAASPPDLALLEDRVALRQGKEQIYGSQIGRNQETGEYYVSPLMDPENVNQRRAEVGLGPIEDYISNWDLTWDAEAFKNGKTRE
ncbi:DUF6624 domain-containing protein [Salinimicrobium oceani]|uniref:Tetratricopeptide repeat-containing protein n=1 Tax=Salinimicrobium oceani TaxID=2722702 RepID=A0ABX1CUH8_9FLAO|nr:DUF6624 domain-containing protein [Salinimicrobium oceani]NJW51955.1 hypothetical protein [Salinimicrobium oceani]